MVIGITQDMENIFAAAIARYGIAAQQDMVIEEMSELTKAILKQRRIQNNPSHTLGDIYKAENNIAEEMADVLIMLTQMFIMQKNIPAVEKAVIEKTNRLAERLGIKPPEPKKDIGLVCTVIAPDGSHIEHEFSSIEELRKQYYHPADFPDLPDEDDPVTSCELRTVPIYVDCFGDIITLLGIGQETEDEE